MIRHVVLMKLNDPYDAPEAQSRLEALLPAIPTLLSMEVGIDVLRTESSYDLSLITTADDLTGFQAYLDHPAHQEFLTWVRPRLAARVAVDSEH